MPPGLRTRGMGEMAASPHLQDGSRLEAPGRSERSEMPRLPTFPTPQPMSETRHRTQEVANSSPAASPACLPRDLCHHRCEGMMFEIVGREKELALVDAFVANSHEGPAALVLEGEAGIGKSTLWHA